MLIEFISDEAVEIVTTRPTVEFIQGGPRGDRGPDGVAGPPGAQTLTYSIVGNLTPLIGTQRLYIEADATIESVRASVNTAPIAQDVIITVNQNGLPIASPTIPIGENTDVVITAIDVATGDYLTVDVDQADGADLIVSIKIQPQ